MNDDRFFSLCVRTEHERQEGLSGIDLQDLKADGEANGGFCETVLGAFGRERRIDGVKAVEFTFTINC